MKLRTHCFLVPAEAQLDLLISIPTSVPCITAVEAPLACLTFDDRRPTETIAGALVAGTLFDTRALSNSLLIMGGDNEAANLRFLKDQLGFRIRVFRFIWVSTGSSADLQALVTMLGTRPVPDPRTIWAGLPT